MPSSLGRVRAAFRPGMNVISAMMEIAANPVTRDGKQTTPITYDSNCLEEICGSCAMLINGKARMACSALVDKLEQPIKLEPFSKFPVVRDLSVDRSVLFENLKRVKAWVPIDGTYDLGSGRAHHSAGSGRSVSAVELHLLHHVAWRPVRSSTRTPASWAQRPFAGAALQCTSHRQGSQRRSPARTHGRRRHPGVWLRSELRGSLSEADPAYQLHLRRRPPGHGAGDEGHLHNLDHSRRDARSEAGSQVC